MTTISNDGRMVDVLCTINNYYGLRLAHITDRSQRRCAQTVAYTYYEQQQTIREHLRFKVTNQKDESMQQCAHLYITK
jgi:hypothetical protein